MPVTPTHPGVSIEETSGGERSITGVATSITAFIGRALRGPVNKADMINSYGDFERIFGGLWAGSTLGYAVRDFYANGGGQAIVVRLYCPTFSSEKEWRAALATAKAEAQAAADAVARAAVGALTEATSTPTSVADAAKAVVDTAAAPSKAARLAATAVARAAEDAAAVAEPVPTPESVAAAAAGAVAAAAEAAAIAVAPRTKAKLSVNGLELEAAHEGAWGNHLRARIDHHTRPARPGEAANSLFNLTIHDDGTGQTEAFRNLSITVGHARQVDKVLENESKLARGKLPATCPAAHADPAGRDMWEDSVPTTNSRVADDGKASDGLYLTKNSFTGDRLEAKKQGLYALEDADFFNLLCVPPFLEPSDPSVTSGDIDYGLIDSLITYCEKRRAMLLIDPPTSWDSSDSAKSGVQKAVGSPSKNAAIFFPRLKQPNPCRGNQSEEFAPCGAVAGVFARTDIERGVWMAPAGLEATLRGIPDLSVRLTDSENSELNRLGINCLRSMPPAGRVVWGSRTRVGDDRLASEWKYIPVRRLALYIEQSVYRGTKWVVFEPNDEALWATIRLTVGAFVYRLFLQGAFQGATPEEAYLVKCDRETTTRNDIDLGIVNILIGFAPLRPAEFVIIKIQQMAGQIET